MDLFLETWQMYVSVSSEFLKIIEKNVHNKRPAWRVDAAEIDLRCDSALLMSDHSIFPSGKGLS